MFARALGVLVLPLVFQSSDGRAQGLVPAQDLGQSQIQDQIQQQIRPPADWARADEVHQHRTYSAHLPLGAGKVRHYYLTERLENQERIFSLFVRDNRGLQDLAMERHFPLSEAMASESWLKDTLQKYSLQLQTPFVYASNDNENWATEQEESAALDTPVLWQADKAWNEKWEQKYAEWVSKELHPRLMVDLQLPTDCADLAYVLRWAFARQNHLPMAIRLGGSSQLFTNESMREEWLDLPQHQDWKRDRRFRAVLEYIMRNTYTHTLMEDSYPVAIRPGSLSAGTHFLDLHGSSGHTMVVKSVNDPNDLPVTLLFSTVPIRIRELISTFYQDQEAPKLHRSGLYKIRWATKTNSGWKLVPLKDHPSYSLEQFNLPDIEFPSPTPHFLKVYQRINPKFSLDILLQKSMNELRDRMKDRIKMVEDGFAFCQRNNCEPGSRGDDDWSTPSRDRRLLQLHETVELALDLIRHHKPEALPAGLKNWEDFAREQTLKIQGEPISLERLVVAFEHGLTETDPRVSIARRWGVAFEGYSENLIASLKTNLAKRQNAGGVFEGCRETQCHESMAEIDKLLRRQISGARILCQHSGGTFCEELNEQLANQSFAGRSLLEWTRVIGEK